ncbi:phytoene/squalene synthase family protein [Alicyclobacillus tolerans]|uniref:Phytoene synthase n=1 Tax=Alicyclobacillus tolerans TaxID=90970 RepID=A0ABT9LT81_9BACL|nr:phytoene/squalene synthase family protein [Alicyclobacillus tengchongensis]MDP9727479.1 phytoene synthase [Alicyclobacillus tengchongensis]
MTLDEAYSVCKSIARQSGTSFYYGLQLLPVVKRRSMYAVYAWSRLCDDAVDEFSGEEAMSQLNRIQEVLERALADDYEQQTDAIVYALGDSIRRFQIPIAPFYGLLEGMRMDIQPQIYRTFDELKEYLKRVAGTIGEMCIGIFGIREGDASEMAVDMGIALQLTNILRDLKEDVERGRIYLPQEDFERFGYSMGDLKALRHTPAFIELMSFQVSRAYQFYHRVRPLFSMVEPDSLRCMRVLYMVYFNLLKRIEEDGYNVLTRRIRISTPRKLWLVGETLWRPKMV